MLSFAKTVTGTIAFAALAGVGIAACTVEDEAAGVPPANDPQAAGAADGADAAESNPQNPNDPAAGVPVPRVQIMGEAEMGEYYTRTFELTDDNDVVTQVKYLPIGNEGLYEHHSFFTDMQGFARYQYQNMMPNNRDIASFSQTQADGFFALGSHFCVVLFNGDMAQATRKKYFGVDDFAYDAVVSAADADKVIGVIFDRVAMASSVDINPMRSDMIKIMRDEYDEAVAKGVAPRNALEETCSVLMGSLVPYVL